MKKELASPDVRRVLAVVFTGLLFVVLFGTRSAFADDAIVTMTPEVLQKRLQSDAKPLVVDVREQEEFDAAHIDGAMLKPLSTVESLDVDKNREIVLVCRSGRRSAKAYSLLEKRGYTKLWNLDGGMLAWEKAGLPEVKPQQKQ